jgi:hypothetical protein
MPREATKLPATAARKYCQPGYRFIHPRFIIAARGCAPFSFSEGASMMTITSRAAVVAIASLLFAGTASAQTTTAPASSTPAAAPAKKAEKPHSPESIECSKQADEKGLHGKERKKFRSDCLKEAKAGAAKTK